MGIICLDYAVTNVAHYIDCYIVTNYSIKGHNQDNWNDDDSKLLRTWGQILNILI